MSKGDRVQGGKGNNGARGQWEQGAWGYKGDKGNKGLGVGKGGDKLTIDDLVIIFSSASKNVSNFLSLISSSSAVAMLVCMSILFFFSNSSGSELCEHNRLQCTSSLHHNIT